jgi:hypothetical protein
VIGAFWGQAAGKLADRWLSVSSSAIVFWVGMTLAVLLTHGSAATADEVSQALQQGGPATQTLVILVALLGVTASGLVVQRLTTPALRIFEGYWPTLLRPLLERRLCAVTRRLEKDNSRWAELASVIFEEKPTRAELDEFNRLDTRLRHVPDNPLHYMPTSVGNILRAAETRPTDRYGIGVIALWPHLWSLLPEPQRQDLATARLALDNAVAACLWAVIFLFAATPLTWWAVLPALTVCSAGWFGWIPARARVFADLVEAACDLHRLDLYKAMGLQPPVAREDEQAAGRALTELVLRGTGSGKPATADGGGQ